MKIAHVLRRLSFDDWGGTEQVVWNIARAQKAAGHEVRIFATTALCATPHEVVDGLEITRFRPIYPWWPMPKWLVDELDRKGGNPFVPGLGRALCDWKPDVIHCHAMARIAELCLRMKEEERRKREEVRCVISLHGGGANVPGVEARSLRAPTRGRLPWGKMIDYAMGWVRRIPEDFDGIVCVGEDEYEKYRAKHPHVLFLPNGVDTKLFDCSQMTIDTNVHKSQISNIAPRLYVSAGNENSQLPTPNSQLTSTRSTRSTRLNSQLVLLCVARIDRQKNQMMIVEALARHPEMSARLVGPVTQPDYADELKRRAEALGVSDRLTIVGALKPGSPELVSEYRNADVFVLPSRHEPFGIVVLEAWAAGLPVVASDVGGLGRLCAAHPGAAVTFPSGDSAAMDAAVAEVRGRILSGAEAIRDAARTAAGQYDWAVLARRLVDFFGQI